jgi:FADH2 O2-dependent halogenase
MSHEAVDVAVLGSGFAGSLAAWILAKQGRRVALIEHGKHPRFAIGESSTPLADFKLRQIAQRYQLPELKPFCQYGSWKAAYPEITCGAKRGFAYFYHQPGQAFAAGQDSENQLLVTANSSQFTSDTHWLRSDVDAFFVQKAIDAGALYFDQSTIIEQQSQGHQRFVIEREGQRHTIDARFLLVATGNPQLWNGAMTIPSTGILPRTNTRSIFAHFAGVARFADVMQSEGQSTSVHPFDCDQSALHHVFDGGWMWQLRFDDETTSVGFTWDARRHPADSQATSKEVFTQWLDRFPSIKRQFTHATIVRPDSQLRQVARLQHELRQAAGDNWALLPAAVGYSDPLFSTGIGHSLFAVDSLIKVLGDLDHPERLREGLNDYGRRLAAEIDLVDRIVSMAYRASSRFAQYVACTMTYFAAATTCEQALKDDPEGSKMPAFLLADGTDFLESLGVIEQGLRDASCNRDGEETDLRFEAVAREALAPFNHVGLFEPEMPRMYRYTAAK